MNLNDSPVPHKRKYEKRQEGESDGVEKTELFIRGVNCPKSEGENGLPAEERRGECHCIAGYRLFLKEEKRREKKMVLSFAPGGLEVIISGF